MEEQLKRSRDRIVRKWTDALLNTYSPEMARFIRKEKDLFANPVGAAVRTSLGPLFDALVDDESPERMVAHLDQLIQIRCVQDFAPSEAVGFLLEIKGIVRTQLSEQESRSAVRFLETFDRRVDLLVLRAFDRLAMYRDRTWEVRIREVKRRVATLARMSRLTDQDLDPGVAPTPATE